MQTSTLNSPHLEEEPVIYGLPPHIQKVPLDREGWDRWREDVLLHREYRRRKCENDPAEQAFEMAVCKRDPAYWLTMYGVLFEPRSIAGNPPQWFRWIPFPFQVQMIRWIQDCMGTTEHGRGDGIIEKSRDMGASWTMCGYIAWAWLFEDAFVAGVVSRNANQVDATNASDTLFAKLRALLGLLPHVPKHIRLPEWMMPAGMNDDYNTKMMIAHPSKTCVIQGETSTALAGVGGRSSLRFNDEAARFQNFDEAWASQGGTSDHRFAVSSADLVSPGFREMALRGQQGLDNPYMEAPSYMRLDYWYHPYHDEEWLRDAQARYSHDPHYFNREYLIDYFAGAGDAVYPRFTPVSPIDAPYDPAGGTLYCVIDPGIADPTAIVWIQEDTRSNRYRVIKGYETPGRTDPEFVASILTGIEISGHGGFDYRDPYLRDLMKWTRELRRQIIYYGDPAGNAAGGDGKRTFYQAITEKAMELTNGQNKISINYITADSARSFEVRMRDLSQLSPQIDFDHDAGAVHVLTALKESRFPERSPHRAYSKEVKEPQHDRWSHIRSAMEFWAVNIRASTRVKAVKKGTTGRPMRITMSGRRIR